MRGGKVIGSWPYVPRKNDDGTYSVIDDRSGERVVPTDFPSFDEAYRAAYAKFYNVYDQLKEE